MQETDVKNNTIKVDNLEDELVRHVSDESLFEIKDFIYNKNLKLKDFLSINNNVPVFLTTKHIRLFSAFVNYAYSEFENIGEYNNFSEDDAEEDDLKENWLKYSMQFKKFLEILETRTINY